MRSYKVKVKVKGKFALHARAANVVRPRLIPFCRGQKGSKDLQGLVPFGGSFRHEDGAQSFRRKERARQPHQLENESMRSGCKFFTPLFGSKELGWKQRSREAPSATAPNQA